MEREKYFKFHFEVNHKAFENFVVFALPLNQVIKLHQLCAYSRKQQHDFLPICNRDPSLHLICRFVERDNVNIIMLRSKWILMSLPRAKQLLMPLTRSKNRGIQAPNTKGLPITGCYGLREGQLWIGFTKQPAIHQSRAQSSHLVIHLRESLAFFLNIKPDDDRSPR